MVLRKCFLIGLVFLLWCCNQSYTVTEEQLFQSGIPRKPSQELTFPEGIRYAMVETNSADHKFLHDPAIIHHRGELIAAWYSCPEGEIVDESSIRARRSHDDGLTWSDIEVIAEDKSKSGLFYVPVQLLSYSDSLYAFIGTMTGHDRIVNTQLYQYDEQVKRWEEKGELAPLFLPNCTPMKMGNGNWILAGRVASALGNLPLIPAVMISDGDDLKKPWRVVKLRAEEYREDQYPETTVIVQENTLLAFVRADGPENQPHIYKSQDYGESWQPVAKHNFYGISAKYFAGRLSDGRGYVVYDYLPGNTDSSYTFDDRRYLAISVSEDRHNPFVFSQTYLIQRSGEGRPLLSHYPCVLEHNGNLYVVYTVNFEGEDKRQCQIAIVPVASLSQ